MAGVEMIRNHTNAIKAIGGTILYEGRYSASMRVFVVGHTDMTGNLEHNLDPSERRAQSVVEALATRFGIARDRMTGRGTGPLSPVGSNDSHAGRALDRRVELVKR